MDRAGSLTILILCAFSAVIKKAQRDSLRIQRELGRGDLSHLPTTGLASFLGDYARQMWISGISLYNLG